MLESLEAVLEFLQPLGVSAEGRKPFVDMIRLIAMQGRPASRPPVNWAMVFVAIQRLIDAGMSEPEAIQDVATLLAGLRGVGDPSELLKRVKRKWKARGPLQDYTPRKWFIATAQDINRKILAAML